ncbi:MULTISPECIES: hypothetical protein [Microcoleaceae]|nr:hypothetical protein [Tychonema sp. LEGE 06208]MBE9164791.1 hypothetical protein [Tychonema sp. LEGE 06208]
MLSFFSLKMRAQTSLAPNSVYGKAFFGVRSTARLVAPQQSQGDRAVLSS